MNVLYILYCSVFMWLWINILVVTTLHIM